MMAYYGMVNDKHMAYYGEMIRRPSLESMDREHSRSDPSLEPHESRSGSKTRAGRRHRGREGRHGQRARSRSRSRSRSRTKRTRKRTEDKDRQDARTEATPESQCSRGPDINEATPEDGEVNEAPEGPEDGEMAGDPVRRGHGGADKAELVDSSPGKHRIATPMDKQMVIGIYDMMKAKFRNMPHPQIHRLPPPPPPPPPLAAKRVGDEEVHSEQGGDQHVHQARETETKEHKSGDEEDESDMVVLPEQVCAAWLSTDAVCDAHAA